MIGDDQRCFCLNCEKDVFNLSAMSRRKARKLIAGNAGKICVRYVCLPNGKLYTNDKRLHQITRRISTIAAGFIATTLTLSAATYAQGEAVLQTSKEKEVVEQIAKEVIGTSQITFILGVSEAGVELIHKNTKQKFVGLTGENGEVSFSSLPKGLYEVNFSARNFSSKSRVFLHKTIGSTGILVGIG